MNLTKAAEIPAYALHCHKPQSPLQQNSGLACLKLSALNAKQNKHSLG